jgi:hypothetical protein
MSPLKNPSGNNQETDINIALLKPIMRKLIEKTHTEKEYNVIFDVI